MLLRVFAAETLSSREILTAVRRLRKDRRYPKGDTITLERRVYLIALLPMEVALSVRIHVEVQSAHHYAMQPPLKDTFLFHILHPACCKRHNLSLC